MTLRKQAFTLVEVLIFVSIISVFFVIAASVATVALHNIAMTQRKIIGTRYAEEMQEWLRYQKDSNWNTFATKATVLGTNYCFNNQLSDGSWPQSDACALDGIISVLDNNDKVFSRKVTLTSVNQQINVLITVSWIDGASTQKTVINTTFAPWE